MTAADRPMSIAILALGGQGGGVLAGWIVATAEANGWQAQSTSVPGVAQRTGATLYYIEIMPGPSGKAPVLALMPTPGDVDIVIASELMEAGRAILRGLVTPDRTTLITSTQRAYAVAEKEQPGEGIGDPQAVAGAAQLAARRIIAFDMDALAQEAETVISAPLLGALAASDALPFSRESFLAVVESGGRSAAASRMGFEAGYARVAENALPRQSLAQQRQRSDLPAMLGDGSLDDALEEIQKLPVAVQPIALAGFKRTVDFQDPDYGRAYLARLAHLHRLDDVAGGLRHGYAFTAAAAKHLANAMAYDDVIGVADLKIRSRRFARIAGEMNAGAYAPMKLTEYMHPRAEELVGLLPHRLGASIAARPAWMSRLDRWFSRGRHIHSNSLSGFLQLLAVASLRRFRRRLLRHAVEMQHLEAWLEKATVLIDRNYDLATGILLARRLVKGYSDTHARGLSKFDRVLSSVPQLRDRDDAGAWMSRLISAALKDEGGEALDGALRTLRSL